MLGGLAAWRPSGPAIGRRWRGTGKPISRFEMSLNYTNCSRRQVPQFAIFELRFWARIGV